MFSARLLYLGGGSVTENGIGPSASVLEVDDIRIGVDYGLEFLPGKKYGYPDEKVLKGKKLDYLLLTHAHTDHIGSILVGWRREVFQDNMKILATPQTKAALWPALFETWKRCAECGGNFGNILKTEKQCEIVPFGEYKLAPGIKIFFGSAGHVPGAFYSVIQIKIGKNKKNILFMGDVCWHDQEVVAGSQIPDDLPNEYLPDLIAITDLTSVAETSSDYELEETRLVDYVLKSLAAGKKVVLPAFAIARGQNVAILFKKAGIKEVYVDGSIKEYFEIFEKNLWSPRDKQISHEGITFIQGHRERKELIAREEPLVVATTAGMGDGGPVREWLDAGLEKKDFVFAGVGYATPESTLGRLYDIAEFKKKNPDKKRFIKIEDDRTGKKERYEVIADIERFRLSGHSGLGLLTQMCEKIVKRRNGQKMTAIGLTHGSRRSKNKAALFLREYAETVYHGEPGAIFNMT